MPLLKGAEAASVLKRMMPSVPIILFTMYDFGDAIAAAVGVDVVLSKPEGVDQSAIHLKRILNEKNPKALEARSVRVDSGYRAKSLGVNSAMAKIHGLLKVRFKCIRYVLLRVQPGCKGTAAVAM
jgi:CheY-like chemotaxis protein